MRKGKQRNPRNRREKLAKDQRERNSSQGEEVINISKGTYMYGSQNFLFLTLYIYSVYTACIALLKNILLVLSVCIGFGYL